MARASSLRLASIILFNIFSTMEAITLPSMEAMSKSLSSALLAAVTTATSPAGAGGIEAANGRLIGLLAGGLCVLAGWVLLRILRPEKLFLRRVPARRNHVNLLHVLGLFLLNSVSGWLGIRAWAAMRGIQTDSPGHLPMTVKIPGAIFAQLVLIGATLTVAGITFRHGLRRGLGLSLRHGLCDCLRAAMGCLAALPPCYAALMATRLLMPSAWITDHEVLTFLPGASALWLGVAVVSTVVLAPIAEELLYRGLLQSMIREYTHRPWPAIILASALFAGSHLPYYQDMPALFVLAVALGYNYERTGRLVAPIVLHALFNAAMIWTTLAR